MTYNPGIFTGAMFHCDNIPNESFGEQLIDNGKAVLKTLEWIRKIPILP